MVENISYKITGGFFIVILINVIHSTENNETKINLEANQKSTYKSLNM